MKRLCSNCGKNTVDESKQTFIYRDYLGNNCDACISPLCNECIKNGKIKNEDGILKLYVNKYDF